MPEEKEQLPSRELPEDLQRAKAVVEEIEQLQRTHHARVQRLGPTRERVESARKAIGKITDDDDDITGLEEYRNAKETQEALRESTTLLLSQMRDRDAEVVALQEKVPAALEQYCRDVISEFQKKEFEPAFQMFAPVLRRGFALADALGDKLDPKGEEGFSLGPALLKLPDCGPWRSDASAVALHDQFCEGQRIAKRLNDFGWRVRHHQRQLQEISRHGDAVYAGDREATFVVVRSFHDADGREFLPGQVIDRWTLADPTMLRALSIEHRIRRRLDSEEVPSPSPSAPDSSNRRGRPQVISPDEDQEWDDSGVVEIRPDQELA